MNEESRTENYDQQEQYQPSSLTESYHESDDSDTDVVHPCRGPAEPKSKGQDAGGAEKEGDFINRAIEYRREYIKRPSCQASGVMRKNGGATPAKR